MNLFFRICWLWMVLSPFFVKGERPSVEQIAGRVGLLGDEDFSVRQDASTRLREWSEAYPRYMLQNLAEAYSSRLDMERAKRLEELMEPLVQRLVLSTPPAFIGIQMSWREAGREKQAVEINEVLAGHAAEEVGLRAGDLILEVNGTSVREMGSMDVFSETIAGYVPGVIVDLRIRREEEEFVQALELGVRPDFRESREEREQRFEDWMRKLAGADETYDPEFPVGHFPME